MNPISRNLYPALALGLAVVSGVIEFVALHRSQLLRRQGVSA